MYYPISDANCITLNTLKALLSPESRQTDYLTMLFPPELNDFDTANLLDFIYDTENITLRNTRTTFTNGNIIRQNDKQTYSRANQTKLTVITRWLRCPGSEALGRSRRMLRAIRRRLPNCSDRLNMPETVHICCSC